MASYSPDSSCMTGYDLLGARETECKQTNTRKAELTYEPPTCQATETTPESPGAGKTYMLIS